EPAPRPVSPLTHMEDGRKRWQKWDRVAVFEAKSPTDDRRGRPAAAEGQRLAAAGGVAFDELVESRHRRARRVAHDVRVCVWKNHQVARTQPMLARCTIDFEPAFATLDEVKRRELPPRDAEAPRRCHVRPTEDRALEANDAQNIG